MYVFMYEYCRMTAHFPVSYHSSSTHTSLPVRGRELPVPEGERENGRGEARGTGQAGKVWGGKKVQKNLECVSSQVKEKKVFIAVMLGPNNPVMHIYHWTSFISWYCSRICCISGILSQEGVKGRKQQESEEWCKEAGERNQSAKMQECRLRCKHLFS